MNARILLVPAAVAALAGAVLAAPAAPIPLPEFSRLFANLSEPEGYFDTDNFVSNEAAYLRVLPALRRLGVHGGAYIGVGPDQNYSYIAALAPELSVIIDIRRQNSMEHLYLKALFQLSPNRAAFLERLFGRRAEPSGGSAEADTLEVLLDRIGAAPADPGFARRSLDEAERVIHGWKLPLASADLPAIETVARAFFEGGPDLKFRSFARPARPYHPTYRELLLETDGTRRVNYLSDEAAFRRVKALHAANRILPVVGDFAGSHAFASVAGELRRRGLAVRCFYASNVEFYLYGGARWGAYVRNLRGLPLDPEACIIRSCSSPGRRHPAAVPGSYMTTVLQRLGDFLRLEARNEIGSYWDMVTRDCIAP